MLDKKTVVNQIEVTQNNAIQVRLALQIVVGAEVISSKWHRLHFVVFEDIDVQIVGYNDHLIRMGEKAIDVNDIVRIKAIAAALV